MTKNRRNRQPPRGDAPVGPRQELVPTPLYVKCVVCVRASGFGHHDNVCVCERGFVETGYTQERFDELVTRTELLIVAIAEALEIIRRIPNKNESLESVCGVLRKVEPSDDEVVTARSHTKNEGSKR